MNLLLLLLWGGRVFGVADLLLLLLLLGVVVVFVVGGGCGDEILRRLLLDFPSRTDHLPLLFPYAFAPWPRIPRSRNAIWTLQTAKEDEEGEQQQQSCR